MSDISAQALDTIQGDKQGMPFGRRTSMIFRQQVLPFVHCGFSYVNPLLNFLPIRFEHRFFVSFVPVVWSSHGWSLPFSANMVAENHATFPFSRMVNFDHTARESVAENSSCYRQAQLLPSVLQGDAEGRAAFNVCGFPECHAQPCQIMSRPTSERGDCGETLRSVAVLPLPAPLSSNSAVPSLTTIHSAETTAH